MKITEMSTPTADRVKKNTAAEINERIRQRIEEGAAGCAAAGPAAIDQRLAELDQEWDVERVLEAEAASMVLLGVGLGAVVNRRFYAVPVVVAGMLLTHALQGWYPLLPLFRRLGLRTQEEIRMERNALKALRGDFPEVSGAGANGSSADVAQILLAVQR